MNEFQTTHARLPHQAKQVFDLWQTLRVADAVPALGVIAEGVSETHPENPRGKPFLYDASPEVAAKWSARVNHALDRGIAFWAVSRGVRTRDWVHFGRLGLPMRAQDDAALLLLFFKLQASEMPDDDAERITWLAPDDA